MKRNIISYIIIAIISMMFVTSCEYDRPGEDGNSPTDNYREITFKINIPTYTLPETLTTRSMKEKEVEISRVDVLVFSVDGVGNETLIYKNKGTNIIQSSNLISFRSMLREGNDINIVLVANAEPLDDVISSFSEGDHKADILSKLIINNTEKWASDGDTPSGYTPIPMYTETGKRNITASINTIENISLRRMLSRIDITVSTSDFTLNRVYLCNYKTKGYISPIWDPVKGSVSMATPTDPNVPSVATIGSEPLSYDVSNNKLESEIYTFESQAPNETDETERKNATCLVIEGIYNGNRYFYRADFTYPTGSNQSKYMPLLRNHRYVFNITQASGIGYSTLAEALDSYSVISNLKIHVVSYDESDMKDINYNGQYLLALNDDSFIAYGDGGNYEISFNTDYPLGSNLVSITNEEGGGTTCSWMRDFMVISSDGKYQEVGIRIDPIPSNEKVRVGYINVQAGRLTASIEVIQTSLSIKKTSNCYMLSPNSESIVIPVLRAEEGIPGSLKRRNNFEEKFIWTDSNSGIGTQGSVLAGKVYGKSRKALLLIESGSKEGNTVVAVRDALTKKIKWSWHIWVTNYSPEVSDQFMDRNLGATSNYVDDNDWWASRGLFYQWGRKDPFPNTYNKPFAHPISYTYDSDGNMIDKIPYASFNDLITSVENPLTFVDFTDDKVRWKGSDMQNPDNSWGFEGEKSVFDPSPEGWRVIKSINAFDKNNFVDQNGWNETDISTVYGDTRYRAGFFSHLNGGFYPGAGGVFYGKNSHLIVNNEVAKVGFYWTAEPRSSTTIEAHVFKIKIGSAADAPNYSERDRAFSIRCVRDN